MLSLWPRISHSLLTICSSSFSSPTSFFCLCLAPHPCTSFFSCTSFDSSFFPNVLSSTFTSKILLSLFGFPPPAFFLPHLLTLFSLLSSLLHFLIPYFPCSYTSQMLYPVLSLPKSSVACLSPAASVLSFPFFPYFPAMWFLPWFFFFYCRCNASLLLLILLF